MNTDLAWTMLLAGLFFIMSGCQQAIEPSVPQSEFQQEEDNSTAASQKQSDSRIDEDDDPFGDTNWSSSSAEGEYFSLFETAEYKAGDLVPCSDDLAEFILEINAMSQGSSFYRRQQSFCRHRGDDTDPRGKPGFTPETLVCAMMSNGFASGTLHYTKFGSKTVSVKIKWSASQGENSQLFQGEFDVQLGQNGEANAGSGNTFAWAFKQVTEN